MILDDIKNTIIYGDCLDIMQQMPANCVDLIVTDPPYEFISKSPQGGGFMENKNKKHLDCICQTFGMSYNPTEYLNECVRITKKFNGYFFTNKSLLKTYIQFAEDNQYKWDILIWSKPNPLPLHNSHYLLDKEYIVFIRESGACFNSKLKYEKYFTIKSYPIGVKKTKHPAEKPVSLLREIICVSSRPDDIIFDGYVGSGSTPLACLHTNRQFIGIDNNAEYVKMANERIEEERDKNHLFAFLEA